MISKESLSSLLPATAFTLFAVLASGCGSGSYSRPEIPKSVAPGWALTWYDRVTPPANLPAGSTPTCWKAVYSGPGSVDIFFCSYPGETAAFDAEQRIAAAAQTVKFQEGRRLVLVHYGEVRHSDLEALVRSIQKRLKD